ncbi:MAG: adenylate kinase family protein [Mycoplasmatales bacterium]
MIILLTGLPGVGKGTQAERIVAKYQIKHLSTGNIFRTLMTQTNELADELNSYISKGALVPDELTIKILKEEIKKDGYQNGFLLDGFPRTVAQAKFLDKLLQEENLNLDYVINLHLAENTIKDRLVNRLFCPNCQATYHKTLIPPKQENICDNCGATLVQRADDKLEKIENRLKIAKEQTLPVIEYYADKVQTIDVNNKSSQAVFDKIESIVK